MNPQAPAPSLLNQTLAERYQVLREIGAGSMGSVYEARHVLLGRRLALKVLKQDCRSQRLKERFFNEARAAGAINHQHIVQVYDFGLVTSGEPFIVMEYVDGESLQAYMDRTGQMPLDDVREVATQILAALEAIHNTGLVHRDVKPGNMMLLKASRPRLFLKLLDFGIARAINEAWDWPTLTRADEVLGTPVYLSPEQAAGGQPDLRWDLWAVAVIVYEMLAAKLPFPTKSLVQISQDIMSHNLTPLRDIRSDLPDWIYRILDKALHKSMDRRFETAGAFLQALDKRDVEPARSTIPGYKIQTSADQAPPPLPEDSDDEANEPELNDLRDTDPVYLLKRKGEQAGGERPPAQPAPSPARAPAEESDEDLKATMVQSAPRFELQYPEDTTPIADAADQRQLQAYAQAQTNAAREAAPAPTAGPLVPESTALIPERRRPQAHPASEANPGRRLVHDQTEAHEADRPRRSLLLPAVLLLVVLSIAGVVLFLSLG